MKLPNATATPSISDAVSGHPSAAHTVTRRSDGISSPPLSTPLSCSPIDSIRNFGVKGNHRRDPPTARDRPFMQPAGNVTLSNYFPEYYDIGVKAALLLAVLASLGLVAAFLRRLRRITPDRLPPHPAAHPTA